MSTQTQDFAHLGKYNWVKISQNNNPQYFWGILRHDLCWLIALASYECWSPNATCLKVKHFPSKAEGVYSTMEDGKVEKKREATCLTNAGQAAMGKFWCDGESQRKYRQSVCLSWEESAERPGVLQFRRCQVPKTCGFSMQWSLQNGITQEFPNDSILLHSTLLGSSWPDPARAYVISNAWQRNTHLRVLLLAWCHANRCWSCVHRLCVMDLCRKHIHVIAVVKAENGGDKLAPHFW